MKLNHKIVSVALFLCLYSFVSGQQETDYLIKCYQGKFDEFGGRSGYINSQGDTVIPMGKYDYCFTDTLKTFAIVMKKNGKPVAIDKNDNELYEVFWFDNGPDYISDGLFRILINGKIGYANTEGKIIIKPQYDCAYPFEEGKALVSLKCQTIQDREHFIWKSDNWFHINKKGRVIE